MDTTGLVILVVGVVFVAFVVVRALRAKKNQPSGVSNGSYGPGNRVDLSPTNSVDGAPK